MTAPLATATRPLLAAVTRVETWFADRQHALHGLSASRILVGTAVLGILVTNFGMRHVQWGPASQWIAAYRADTGAGPLDAVFGTSSTTLFTLAYLAVMALAVAVVLGWRTRLTTALLVVGLASIVERNALIGDQGDNIARIGLLLMVFMNTSAHWSLDARRRRRHAGRRLGLGRRVLHGLPVAPPWLANPVHNAALLALALQLSILYTASALYKVQGEPWQDGTALYHPLSPRPPPRLILRVELGLDPLPQLSRAAPVQRPQRLTQRGLIEPRGPLVELVAGQPVLSHKGGAYLGAALAEVHAPLPGPVPAGVACGVGE